MPKIDHASYEDFRTALPRLPRRQLRRYVEQFYDSRAICVRGDDGSIQACGGVYYHGDEPTAEVWMLPAHGASALWLVRAGAILLSQIPPALRVVAYVDRDNAVHQRFARFLGFTDTGPPESVELFGTTYQRLELER
jgi:hypothetical protein